jgi:hypothetical protein
LTPSTSDQDQLVPLLDAIQDNLGRRPKEGSADAGYLSEANLEAMAERNIDASPLDVPSARVVERTLDWLNRNRRLAKTLRLHRALGGDPPQGLDLGCRA